MSNKPYPMQHLENITKSVCDLCHKTGEFLLGEVNKIRPADVEEKSENNYVTYADKTSEARLMEGLAKIVPGTGFIAEESPQLEQGELNWIIDPLDGTTNFIHRVPVFSISIALAEGENILSSVILEVNSKEIFYTWSGAPSFLNQHQIRVSSSVNVAGSLFATGFPYYDYSKMDAYLNFFRFMMIHSRGIRRLGSAAADLAYVACGRFDGFYEYGLSPWDVAAGTLLVKNAGGKICDFHSGNNYIFGKEIIATNGTVFEEFVTKFHQNFR